ncbi:MAG: phospholipid carrier-dependent glycosyltransferase [Pirellulales bacterium]
MGRRHAAKPPTVSKPAPALQDSAKSWRRPLGIAWLIAGVTLAVALATLGPATGGPGLTVDEYYDADAGKRLVHAWRTEGWRFFARSNVEQLYGTMTLHPPVGRWFVGWVHHAIDAYPDDVQIVWLPGARTASALALALLVGLVGSTAAAIAPGEQRTLAAAGGAMATALMPRLFAHGHLVSLDMLAALFFFAAVATLLLATREASAQGISRRFWIRIALAGAVWGLALGTKISGLLLLPAAGVWFVARYRVKGIALFLLYLLAGSLVFFAAWPWLWFAPLERTSQFLFTATDRATLHTFYEGQVWDDRAVPWHYPWVITAVTVPVGLLALAIYGAVAPWRDQAFRPAVQLTLLALGSVLLTFSWPGVPVYDGERLFLMVYPLLGLLCGLACVKLVEFPWFARHSLAARYGALALLFATQATGLVFYHPFQLSYYNLLVGGLAGAERLGFEVTYWGDTVDHTIADDAAAQAAEETVLLAPNLAPFQAQAVEIIYPAFANHSTRLIGWPGDSTAATRPRYLLVYNRRADAVVPAPLLAQAKLIAENRRQGVWLARLYELPR